MGCCCRRKKGWSCCSASGGKGTWQKSQKWENGIFQNLQALHFWGPATVRHLEILKMCNVHGLTIITPWTFFSFFLLTFPPLVLGGGSGSWIRRCTRPGSRLHQNRPGNCHQQHHCFANPYPSQLKNDWTSRCGCHYCFVHIVLAWGRQIGITPSWKSKVSWSLRSAKSEKVKLS